MFSKTVGQICLSTDFIRSFKMNYVKHLHYLRLTVVSEFEEEMVFKNLIMPKKISAKRFLKITEPLKRQTKISADDILIFYFYLSKKIRLDFSCESSA